MALTFTRKRVRIMGRIEKKAGLFQTDSSKSVCKDFLLWRFQHSGAEFKNIF
jgi:hypothetical protein